MTIFYLLCSLALAIITHPIAFFGCVLVAIIGGFWTVSHQSSPSNPAKGESK